MTVRSIRVLIIDTDHTFARSVDQILHDHLGERVRTIVPATAAAAIPMIEAGEFDIAIVDSGAHDTRGLELIHKGLTLHPECPFIFMTASQDSGLPLLALQAGAVDILEKTDLTPDTLLRSVRQAFHRSTARCSVLEARDRFRSHFMNSGAGAWQCTLDGRFIDVNPAAAAILGYDSVDQLRVLNAGSLHVVQEEQDAYRRELVRDGHITNQELRFKRRDGSVVWCLVNAMITRAAGRPPTVDCTLTDLTDRRFLQTQLRQAQKMEAIGQLAGGVAHDFNNLLTAILGYCDLVLADLPAASRMAADVCQIQAAGERARDLTQQLLAFSRKQATRPQVVNLKSALGRFGGLVPRLLGEHIQVTTHVPPDLWNVLVDPSQLEQILLNLTVNSSDAMAEGGRLTIETHNVELDAEYAGLHRPSVTPGQYVLLAVSDTGAGMSAAVQSHAFEPFFTTKPPGKGTGLGLSTVYGIVKQSRGYIWIYSEEGHGTTFKIYFPRIIAQERLPEPVSKEQDGRGSETVLLVEDEDAVRSLAEVVLQRNGYQVISARNASDALTIVTSGRKVDVVVTDVMMPNMSGPQLARQLHEIRPEIMVLYMSGYTANAIVDQGLIETGSAFLSKPFSSTSLALAGPLGPRRPSEQRSARTIPAANPRTPGGQAGQGPVAQRGRA